MTTLRNAWPRWIASVLLPVMATSAMAATPLPTVARSDLIWAGDTAGLCVDAVVAANGDLIVAAEVLGDVLPGDHVMFVRSADGGRTWSDVYLRIQPDNPETEGATLASLYRRDDGVILASLLKVEMRGGLDSRRSISLEILASADHGYTFEKLASVPLDPAGLNAPYLNMLQLPDGRLIMPGFVEKRGNGYWASADGGRSWSEFQVVWTDPPEGAGHRLAFNETAYVVTDEGHVVAVARNDFDKVFYTIRSTDSGRTWSEPKAINLVGGSPALHRMADGTLLLAYRDAAAPGLALAVSGDHGRHWRFAYHLPEPEGVAPFHAARWTRPADDQHWQPGEGHFGYPSFVDLPDGDVYVAWHVHNRLMDVKPGMSPFSAVGNVIRGAIAEHAAEHHFPAAQIGTLLRAQQRTGAAAAAALLTLDQTDGLAVTPLRIENRTSLDAEVHSHEDDLFIILDGEATFHLGGELVDPWAYGPGNRAAHGVTGSVREYSAGPGDVVFVPRGTAHRITCPDGFVELLVVKRATHP